MRGPEGCLSLGARCQVAYHSGDIPGIDGNFSNPPVKVKENLGSVMDAISHRFHLQPKH